MNVERKLEKDDVVYTYQAPCTLLKGVVKKVFENDVRISLYYSRTIDSYEKSQVFLWPEEKEKLISMLQRAAEDSAMQERKLKLLAEWLEKENA